jgi:tRNA pseudouridine55 synthase
MEKIYNDFSGMLLLDKPLGITSFKAISKIKKILNVKKIGHCGTLDPLATGLLLVLIGKATKLQNKFMSQDKIYSFSFLLGTVSDTGDLDGKIIEQNNFDDIDIEKIKNAVRKFKGEIFQIPPMYSALKHNGKKLYELARQGIEVRRNPRKVTIKTFEILSYENGVVQAAVKCSSGTYIRTLAQDLGRILKCGATVTALRREQIGKLLVNDSLNFTDDGSFEKILKKIIPFDKLPELIDE